MAATPDEKKPDGNGAPGYLMTIPWKLDSTGGVPQVVSNLGRELAALGWVPEVLVTDWEAVRPRLDDRGPLPIVHWRIRAPYSKERPVWNFLGFVATLPFVARTWRRLARMRRWHVVNVHYPDHYAITLLILRRLGLWKGVVLVSVHGSEIRQRLTPGSGIARWPMRHLLRGADAIIACSAELAADVRRLEPRVADRLHVVPNGVNVVALKADVEPGFRLPDPLASRRYVLCVATFEHKKGLDVLIKAFARVAAHIPDVQLALVGRFGPLVADLERLAAASGAGERIHFQFDLPHRCIPVYLAEASLFCLASRAEGHPLALLEAAAFGLPVIATPVGGTRETIPDDRFGLLVPVDDVDALAEAMTRFLEDRDLATSVGARLHERVKTHFSWNQSARMYAEIAVRLGVRPG